LVSNFAVKPCKLMNSTPPVVRTFDFARKAFVEFSELFQGRFEGLWVLDFLTGVQRQIGLQSEVYSYTFTCSGQNFFAGVICNNGQPIRSNTVAKDLDIANVPLPIAVVVIQDIATLKHKLLSDGIPFLEGGFSSQSQRIGFPNPLTDENCLRAFTCFGVMLGTNSMYRAGVGL
jgi:hypothetical protein